MGRGLLERVQIVLLAVLLRQATVCFEKLLPPPGLPHRRRNFRLLICCINHPHELLLMAQWHGSLPGRCLNQFSGLILQRGGMDEA